MYLLSDSACAEHRGRAWAMRSLQPRIQDRKESSRRRHGPLRARRRETRRSRRRAGAQEVHVRRASQNRSCAATSVFNVTCRTSLKSGARRRRKKLPHRPKRRGTCQATLSIGKSLAHDTGPRRRSIRMDLRNRTDSLFRDFDSEAAIRRACTLSFSGCCSAGTIMGVGGST